MNIHDTGKLWKKTMTDLPKWLKWSKEQGKFIIIGGKKLHQQFHHTYPNDDGGLLHSITIWYQDKDDLKKNE